MTRRIAILVALAALTSSALGQSTGEFNALPCKPTTNVDSNLRVERDGRVWNVLVRKDGVYSRVLQSALEPVRPLIAQDAGLLLYFVSDRKYPKNSGWRVQRLSDGTNVQVAESQVPPYSACVSSDGQSLAYVTGESQAVHLQLLPAIERLRVWAGDVPDDRVFVPR
jgi:hypothetical protein